MPKSDIGSGSQRYNQNKIRMTYLPPALINDLIVLCNASATNLPVVGLTKLAEHFSLGSAKYPDGPSNNGFTFPNWAKGQLFDAMLLNSTLRHYYAWLGGEEYDSDFGSHHLIAVAWGVACLHHQFTNYDAYSKFDDRMWVNFSVESVEDNILSNLNIIQVEFNEKTCAYLATCVCLASLKQFEKDTLAELTFNIDVERLQKIQNTNYGKPVAVGGV